VKKFVVLAAVAACVSAPVSAKKEPQLSGLELQQIQARDMETTPEVAFPAVMTVLQDSGYRIQSADKDTGLIVAAGSTTAKMTYNIWWGLGKKKQVPIVSAFIEPRGKAYTRVRLNFVMSTGKSRNTFTDEKPILDAVVYKDAFERIEKEIFTRNAMNAAAPVPAATPTAAPAVAPVTPASASEATATPSGN
jgi:hypothetical protein